MICARKPGSIHVTKVYIAVICWGELLGCRLSAFIVSLLASGRKFRVSVEAIGFLVVRGVTVTFAQVRCHASLCRHSRLTLKSRTEIVNAH